MLKTNRSLVTVILLSIITCGIYGIIFWWGYINDLNTACGNDGQESPNYIVLILLSIITCSIYYYYWLYKQANRIQATAQAYGIPCQENGTTILLWEIVGMFVCGIGALIGTHIMIKNLNMICNQYNIRMQAPR